MNGSEEGKCEPGLEVLDVIFTFYVRPVFVICFAGAASGSDEGLLFGGGDFLLPCLLKVKGEVTVWLNGLAVDAATMGDNAHDV